MTDDEILAQLTEEQRADADIVRHPWALPDSIMVIDRQELAWPWTNDLPRYLVVVPE